MFKALKQEAYIKNFKTIKAGSFTSENGEEVSYDGYQQVVLSMFNKNGELVDIKCRIPNTQEGETLYVSLRNKPVMTKILADFEIQVSASGNAKYFIVGFEIAK